jgi:hypothetical protein
LGPRKRSVQKTDPAKEGQAFWFADRLQDFTEDRKHHRDLDQKANTGWRLTLPLKPKPDGTLLASVGYDCFEIAQISAWVNLYDPEIVSVRFGGDLLQLLRLDVLDKDLVRSTVAEPANEHKLADVTGIRL